MQIRVGVVRYLPWPPSNSASHESFSPVRWKILGRTARSSRVAQVGYRSSPSLLIEAGTEGSTRTSLPLSTQARWLGAKRGAKSPSSSSRVTAKRLNEVGGRNNLSFDWPSDSSSGSASKKFKTPSPLA